MAYPQAFAAVAAAEYLQLAEVLKPPQEQAVAPLQDPKLQEAVELWKTCYLLPEEPLVAAAKEVSCRAVVLGRQEAWHLASEAAVATMAAVVARWEVHCWLAVGWD
ncbi:hypothetical protein PG999_002443 [Apiospora kogelbergensis]|uniref:Uncharacterized protein n=1 Tax=Apiospora kogelbergensis TaxID=1337665 RepID=A0AAW0R8G3_9PEZI